MNADLNAIGLTVLTVIDIFIKNYKVSKKYIYMELFAIRPVTCINNMKRVNFDFKPKGKLR